MSIIDLDQNNSTNSYFKFVKRIVSSGSSKHNDFSFQEIEAAYPWGFKIVQKRKKIHKKPKKISGNSGNKR